MDILLVILGVICFVGWDWRGVFFADLAGAAGGVFGFVAVAFYGLCGILRFTELVVWGLLVVLAQAMDYVTPMLGTKYSGGLPKWGNWGCAVGTVPVCSCFRLGGSYWVLSWGLSWGTFGRQASGDCVEGWFRGVRWVFY